MTSNESGDGNGKTAEPARALPPMDFSTFILSLGSSAMVNLGKISAPGSDEVTIDLAAAKQIVDILGVLEEKTRGNLTDDEKRLMDQGLYECRLQYVHLAQNVADMAAPGAEFQQR